ncbi:hypothetical protein COT20_02755 [bacterium (Candidatus Gribaldobacteria) CG08_land_8_20_14_0_20_39_15]|uniref:Kazal-like domain-containing protein n=1 Tax=bacterium (Candidatus Gribaldobacteria) CG08_land_8_20_14_0_20_39_15 TaxID=2014273 RepID=A0A2M6XTX9_9BACT|nr:MAG: hypothetical protein COT20_02755 [bacterium (Candidatus Gribaldobacteria) CG08_land_8_20_14_0_20_39_15]
MLLQFEFGIIKEKVMKTKIILLVLLSSFFIFGLGLTALVQNKTCQAVEADKNAAVQNLEVKQAKFSLGSIFNQFKNLTQGTKSFFSRVKLVIEQYKKNILKKLSKVTGTKPSDDKSGTSCVCADLYAPVCGADNQTYSNECFANCQKVKVVSKGVCGTKSNEYGSGDYNFATKHQNRTRFYSVHVPLCYSKGKAIPLIINFHGGNSTAEKAEQGIGDMNNKADEACFIGAYPSGVSSVGQPGKSQYWNAGTLVQIEEVDPSIDDVGFISKMLDELEGKFSIDTKKVYATGISNGAWMTYRVACELSDRITAIAPISGGLILENCNPKRPIPIIHFHGTSDPGWPYYGGNGCWTDTYRQPIKETIQKWIEINGCSAVSNITYQKGEASCETYNCQEDSKITFCTIKGGGHTYPGGKVFQQLIPKWDDDCALGQGRGVGKTTKDIKALDAMWEFFQSISK